MSLEECEYLAQQSDRIIKQGKYDRDAYGGDVEDLNGLRRISLRDMDDAAKQISENLILERVLPTLEREQPNVLQSLHLNAFRRMDSTLEWASDEPTVNRYVCGGEFESHEDGYALTCIVLLSDQFEGGGTTFFPTGTTGTPQQVLIEEGVLIQPSVGSALLFNGDITHAGNQVKSGTRHVYVASFNVVTSPRVD